MAARPLVTRTAELAAACGAECMTCPYMSALRLLTSAVELPLDAASPWCALASACSHNKTPGSSSYEGVRAEVVEFFQS